MTVQSYYCIVLAASMGMCSSAVLLILSLNMKIVIGNEAKRACSECRGAWWQPTWQRHPGIRLAEEDLQAHALHRQWKHLSHMQGCNKVVLWRAVKALQGTLLLWGSQELPMLSCGKLPAGEMKVEFTFCDTVFATSFSKMSLREGMCRTVCCVSLCDSLWLDVRVIHCVSYARRSRIARRMTYRKRDSLFKVLKATCLETVNL